MKKQPWIVFFAHDGRELAAFTVRGTFEGELEETLSLLAYENNLSASSISFAEITR